MTMTFQSNNFPQTETHCIISCFAGKQIRHTSNLSCSKPHVNSKVILFNKCDIYFKQNCNVYDMKRKQSEKHMYTLLFKQTDKEENHLAGIHIQIIFILL